MLGSVSEKFIKGPDTLKGTSFQKPLELKLIVDGESWYQGDLIQGTFEVKNQGATEVTLSELGVLLAQGDLKKVTEKKADAFKIISPHPIAATLKLEPQGETKAQWRFQLDPNCPVNDTRGSLYLLYGQGTTSTSLGQLQLTILPSKAIHKFIDTLQIEFRFVKKSIKFTKAGVEVKFAPPSAKGFGSIESLVIQFQNMPEALHVKYIFALKTIDMMTGTMQVVKTQREYEQELNSKDDLQKAIDGILEQNKKS